MSKQVIIAVIAAVVVVGGGAAYFLTSNNDTSSSNVTTTQQTANSNTSTENVFDAVTTNGVDFTATLTTTEGDKTYVGTMKQDKDSGNTSYEVDIDGKQALTVYTSDAYYFCQTIDNCIKYPLNQISASNFDPESYTYTDEEIATYRNGASYEGVKQCGSKSCDTWKISKDNLDTMLYIDTDTNQIVQVEGTTPNGNVKIVYDYQDVTVTPPANAREIPNLQQ